MIFSIHPYLDLKRHPSVYGPVRFSNNASVYLPIMLQKCPVYMTKFLFMSQKQSFRMLLYSCLYLGFQGQLLYAYISIPKSPSVYAHVRASIYASIYTPIARTPLNKCTYVVLKNVPLCMPMSGSLYMLPYICPLQGHPSPNAHTWFSKMPVCMPMSGSLYTCVHTYAHCKDTPLQTHICGSQKCPCLGLNVGGDMVGIVMVCLYCNVWGCVCVGFVLYGCVRFM